MPSADPAGIAPPKDYQYFWCHWVKRLLFPLYPRNVEAYKSSKEDQEEKKKSLYSVSIKTKQRNPQNPKTLV